MPAGASPTPQAKKLGITSGHRLAMVGAPSGWALEDPPLTEPVSADEPADVIIAFFTDASSIRGAIASLGARIFPYGTLWIAWPRRAGGHTSDITDSVVRSAALSIGLVDVKVAAMDNDWSGLKVVWRRERRPGGELSR